MSTGAGLKRMLEFLGLILVVKFKAHKKSIYYKAPKSSPVKLESSTSF